MSEDGNKIDRKAVACCNRLIQIHGYYDYYLNLSNLKLNSFAQVPVGFPNLIKKY
jgi:hypothetical protein